MKTRTSWGQLGFKEGCRSYETGEPPILPNGPHSQEKWDAYYGWAVAMANKGGFALGGATEPGRGMVSGESPERVGGLPHETPDAPAQPRTFDGAAYLRRNFNRR